MIMQYMSKSLFISVIVCLVFSTNVMAACDLERFSFGSSYNKVQKHFGSMLESAPVSRQMFTMPGEEVCAGERTFVGVPVFFTFLYDKLVQIEVNRLSKKPLLGPWAESVYGTKPDKPPSYFGNQPNAQWSWESSSKVILYSITTQGLEMTEYLQIQSTMHQHLFERLASEEESN